MYLELIGNQLEYKRVSFSQMSDFEGTDMKKIEQAIQENKNIIISGPSGAGKTTLLEAIQNQISTFGNVGEILLIDEVSTKEDLLSIQRSLWDNKQVIFAMQGNYDQTASERIYSDLFSGSQSGIDFLNQFAVLVDVKWRNDGSRVLKLN